VTQARSKSGETPFNKTSFLLFTTHKTKHSRDLLCGTFCTQKCCYVSFERLDIFISSIQHASCGGSLLQAQSHSFDLWQCSLTFKNRASYRWDGRTATLQKLHFIYFFQQLPSTEYFKHAAHSPFFYSKCRLFHNATFFGSCIIHILHTGCAKI